MNSMIICKIRILRKHGLSKGNQSHRLPTMTIVTSRNQAEVERPKNEVPDSPSSVAAGASNHILGSRYSLHHLF